MRAPGQAMLCFLAYPITRSSCDVSCGDAQRPNQRPPVRAIQRYRLGYALSERVTKRSLDHRETRPACQLCARRTLRRTAAKRIWPVGAAR